MSKPTYRCWKCHATAHVEEWAEITALADPQPRYVPVSPLVWPHDCVHGLGDHDYFGTPTPWQLADRGQRVLETVNRITLEALL